MSNLHQQQDFEQAEALKTQKSHPMWLRLFILVVGSMIVTFYQILLAVYDFTP